ncbi:prepilin-type N-terminal cleavage/methylation domain-containing protein [bacterium]|nr:prepilin-type N-terminal cleavage/methylation domain-containing protein [bacterium]
MGSAIYPNHNLNRSGFSILEALVAMGIASVVTLGVMQTLGNLSDGQVALTQTMNASDLVTLVQQTLADRIACQRTFRVGGAVLPVPTTLANRVEVPDIRDRNNNVIVAGSGATYPAAGSVRTGLQNVRFWFSSNTGNVDNVRKAATLQIFFERWTPSLAGTSPQSNKQISLNVTPVANNVSDCTSVAPDIVCNTLGGALDPTTNLCNGIDLTTVAGSRIQANNLQVPAGGGFCRGGGGCDTASGVLRMCPYGGYAANYQYVVGLSAGGMPVCGKSPMP